MARFFVSAKAQTEIREIKEFIARDNPARALSFVRELRARIDRVAQDPLHYRERVEIRQGLRVARHGNYMIFFRFDGNLVEVLRVRHGATDFARLFEEE